MASASSTCRHPDIRDFDGLKCCLSCGLSYHELRSGSPEPDPVSEEATDCKRRYRYRPLNYELGKEIRLLILQPGEFDDPIQVEIVHANLLDNPQYDALSYTWATEDGDASLSRELDCKGKTVAITQNCEAALRRVRGRGLKRTIWVDAVCIDQETIAERNHQVELMGTIYSQAEQVLIYPGELTRYTIAVLRVLEYQRTPDPGDLAFERHITALQNFENGDIFPDELWSLVHDFLSRRWFLRVCVIQELVLARKAQLILNQHLIVLSSEVVLRMRRLCIQKSFEVPGPLAFDPGCRSNSLLSSLQATIRCKATDPKDKVFAILGLLNPDIRSQLSVDYSCSVSDIYKGAAIAVILEQLHLATLSPGFEHGSIFQLQGLPSWVADWRMEVATPFSLTPPGKSKGTQQGLSVQFENEQFRGETRIYFARSPGLMTSLRVQAHILKCKIMCSNKNTHWGPLLSDSWTYMRERFQTDHPSSHEIYKPLDMGPMGGAHCAIHLV